MLPQVELARHEPVFLNVILHGEWNVTRDGDPRGWVRERGIVLRAGLFQLHSNGERLVHGGLSTFL